MKIKVLLSNPMLIRKRGLLLFGIDNSINSINSIIEVILEKMKRASE